MSEMKLSYEDILKAAQDVTGEAALIKEMSQCLDHSERVKAIAKEISELFDDKLKESIEFYKEKYPETKPLDLEILSISVLTRALAYATTSIQAHKVFLFFRCKYINEEPKHD